jgi:photosystem II stability/assembly factor-like uncharacterized protein
VFSAFSLTKDYSLVKNASALGPLTAFALTLNLALLVSCGGGSGSASSSRTEPPPTVTRLTQTPAEPWKNGVVTFDTLCIGSGTLSYEWDLGDGTRKTTTDPFTSHSYLSGGDKPVTVTCTDSTRQKTSLGITVSVDPMDLSSVANRTCSTGRQGKGWCVQNPLPTGSALTNVAVWDRVTAWAITASGVILRTKDGGASWIVDNSNPNHLDSISVASTMVAWATSTDGSILKTENGGLDWSLQRPGTYEVMSILAVNENTAWAIGGKDTILVTTNGGAKWISKPPGSALLPGSVAALTYVAAVDANAAWVVFSPTGPTPNSRVILRTTNGGDTWDLQDAGTTSALHSVIAIDQNTALAVGSDGTILKTKDGGAVWSPKNNTGVTDTLHSMAMPRITTNKSTVWVVGGRWLAPGNTVGASLKSNDAGETWTVQNLPGGTPSVVSVAAVDESTAWAVGEGGTIQKSTGDGSAWTKQSAGVRSDIASIAVVDTNIVWAVDFLGNVLKTEDSGVTWPTKRLSDSTFRRDSMGLSVANANVAWVVDDVGTVLRTTNGGATWGTQKNTGTTDFLSSIAAVSADTAWVVGLGGVIRKTSDGGQTPWVGQTYPPGNNASHDLFFIAAFDQNTAWAVGYNGAILNTTDGGNKWDLYISTPPVSTDRLNSISIVNKNVVWVSGSTDVLRTVDGGRTWEKKASGYFTSVSALDENTAWAVGPAGSIVKTTDGGTNWVSQSSGTYNRLTAVAAWDANTAWTAGEFGSILKTLTGGQ